MKKLSALLLLALLMGMMQACLFLFDDPDNPELITQRDAYYTVVEAHALKQVWMYNYFKTFSNNYSRGQLFVYEPTQAELDVFWEQLATLMTYSEAIDSAIIIIRDAQSNMHSATEVARLKSVSGLFDSMAAFYKWGRNAGKRARERTLLIVSNMTVSQKSQLYSELLRDNWRNEFASESEFWTKLEKGELDDKTPQIYNDFYYNSSYTIDNNFIKLADDKGLTPGKIVAKEGAEGIKAGADVYVEAVKAATPLGKGIAVLEEGRKWYEKAETAVDAPMDMVGDLVKERLSKKIGGLVDVDGLIDAAGLGESTGLVAKGLMELSLGSDNPADIIESGIDWGIAKLSSPDKSIVPEVVFAEKVKSGTGFPDIILGVGNYVNNLGETLLALPQGNWNITVVDKKGNSGFIKAAGVNTSQYVQYDITNENEVAEDKDKEQEIPDSIQLALRVYKIVQLNLIENSSHYYVETWDITNNISGFNEPVAPINWNGGVFTCNFIINRNRGSELTKFEVNIGGTVSIINDTLFISGSGVKKTWIYDASDNVLKLYYELSYRAENMEFGPVKYFNANNTFMTKWSTVGLLDEMLGLNFSYEKYNSNKEVIDKISYNKVSEIENMDAFYISFH